MKIDQMIYLCPRCGGAVEVSRAMPDFGTCPRPAKKAYVDGKYKVIDPGCQNDPPYNLALLHTKIIQVDVVESEA